MVKTRVRCRSSSLLLKPPGHRMRETAAGLLSLRCLLIPLHPDRPSVNAPLVRRPFGGKQDETMCLTLHSLHIHILTHRHMPLRAAQRLDAGVVRALKVSSSCLFSFPPCQPAPLPCVRMPCLHLGIPALCPFYPALSATPLLEYASLHLPVPFFGCFSLNQCLSLPLLLPFR